MEDIGDTRVTVFRQDEGDAQISTILLRGGTKNGLDDLQRSIGPPALTLSPPVDAGLTHRRLPLQKTLSTVSRCSSVTGVFVREAEQQRLN